jgi:hypothetical protein
MSACVLSEVNSCVRMHELLFDVCVHDFMCIYVLLVNLLF